METATEWVPDVDDFPTRLVLIRHKMRWNLKEAALACGIKPQSWREWELDARKPRDYETVCNQISQHTGASLIWLMTGQPPPSPSRGPFSQQGVEPTEHRTGRSHNADTARLPRLDSNQQPFDHRPTEAAA